MTTLLLQIVKRFCLLAILLGLVSACGSYPTYHKAPEGANVAGTWKFVAQDEYSYQRLLNALNYVPLGIPGLSNSDVDSARRENYTYREQKLLRDMLVGIFSIVPKELYIEQTEHHVSIDFGVAGFHTFKLAEKTELIMQGIEVDAYAGWLAGQFIVQFGTSNYYKLIEKFTVINDKLIETIELDIYGQDKPLIHKRHFKLVPNSQN
ncbi:MAG: hypothetical protein COA74_04565 [Gammaproteobacteria bacterium]|nr:MAG: hypothetical protein COA74_04565 [Gammaproteobacteria bacterium]